MKEKILAEMFEDEFKSLVCERTESGLYAIDCDTCPRVKICNASADTPCAGEIALGNLYGFKFKSGATFELKE